MQKYVTLHRRSPRERRSAERDLRHLPAGERARELRLRGLDALCVGRRPCRDAECAPTAGNSFLQNPKQIQT